MSNTNVGASGGRYLFTYLFEERMACDSIWKSGVRLGVSGVRLRSCSMYGSIAETSVRGDVAFRAEGSGIADEEQN